MSKMLERDRMLKWFDKHIEYGDAFVIAKHYAALAEVVCTKIGSGPERTVALRHLLESRDAAVRARMDALGFAGSGSAFDGG